VIRPRVPVLVLLLAAATACAAPAPTPTPAPLPTVAVTPAADGVVARLRAAGLDARTTGQRIGPPSPIAALTGGPGHVLAVEGLAVQVYWFADAAAAERGLATVRDNPVLDWASRAPPRFVVLDNVLVTVVTDDATLADRITAALRT
jgi:hypothetical protein